MKWKFWIINLYTKGQTIYLRELCWTEFPWSMKSLIVLVPTCPLHFLSLLCLSPFRTPAVNVSNFLIQSFPQFSYILQLSEKSF